METKQKNGWLLKPRRDFECNCPKCRKEKEQTNTEDKK